MTPTHAAPRTTGLEPAFLHAAVQDRITNLWAARQVSRVQFTAEWTVKRWECEVELRALLRLARAARRQAEAAPDPMTVARGYHDWQAAAPDVDKVWTEAEMAYAAGQ